MCSARRMLLLEWWYRVFGMMSSPAEPAQIVDRRSGAVAGRLTGKQASEEPKWWLCSGAGRRTHYGRQAGSQTGQRGGGVDAYVTGTDGTCELEEN